MHEGACEQEVKSRGRGIWRTVRTSSSAVLITIVAWYFEFQVMDISILHLKYEYGAQSESRFACYIPLPSLRRLAPLNNPRCQEMVRSWRSTPHL